MADVGTTDRIVAALVRGLGGAVEAVDGQPLAVEAGAAAGGAGWATPIVAAGRTEGTITAWIDQAGVGALARVMLNIDDDPDPSVVGDLLHGLWTQAGSATSASGDLAGVTFTAGTPAPGERGAASGWIVRRGTTPLATIVVSGSLRADTRGGAGAAPSATPGATLPGNLAALLDIDLPLVARFARTEMTLRALTQLGPGSVVDMGRSPDAPVQLLVGSQVVAQGEVVVVGGNYGVRITQLVSPAERLRAMEL
jgi:flagellar motor switch protein FliN